MGLSMRLLFYSFIMSILLVSLAQAMQTSSVEDYFEDIEVQISQEDDDGVVVENQTIHIGLHYCLTPCGKPRTPFEYFIPPAQVDQDPACP